MTNRHRHVTALRQEMLQDPHRPHYHFSAPANWINDPNGLIQWRGQYHLFYQHNPTASTWGNIHWGHAVSDDLVHWTDLPVALTPTPDSPDKDGCWSGVIIDNAGTPTMLYTGVFPEVQCLATGTQDLVTWAKYEANPVLAGPPEHLATVGFRDPCVWQSGDLWYMTIGTGLQDVGGAVLLYRSPDLRSWEYVSVLLTGDKNTTGEMWECPAFFPLGDKHVLLISIFPRVGTYYFVGTFDGTHFTPEHEGVLDWGPHFFAPQTLLDSNQRRIMIGWIWEGWNDNAQERAGWSGIQSIPRQLTLLENGHLGMAPVRELQTLREKHILHEAIALTPTTGFSLDTVQGSSLEIMAEIEAGTADTFQIVLQHSPSGDEETRISFSPARGQLDFDPSQSSANPDVEPLRVSTAIDLAEHDRLKLQLFIDRSVIEIFVNGQQCLTSRVYPTDTEGMNVQFLTHGGNSQIVALDVWSLRSIWLRGS